MMRRKSGHIETDFRDDHAGDDGTDAGDGRQSVDVRLHRLEPVRKPPIDGVDRALDRINLVQMQAKQKAVILGHEALQRRFQLRARYFQLALEPGQAFWRRLAGDDL
jgi:hypothetical protein